MVRLSALDDRVASALQDCVNSNGGACWITSAELLSAYPDIRAHHTAVTHALRRLMQNSSATIADYSISVRSSTQQQSQSKKSHNYRTVFRITSIVKQQQENT
jgi:hypothetical protein